MNPRDIDIQMNQRSVTNILAYTMALTPKWEDEKKVSLIESLLIGFPIGCIYTHTVNGKTLIIDGNERISAIREFMAGEFELSSLKFVPTLNGFYYDQLPAHMQRRIEETVIPVFQLRQCPDVVFNELITRIK